MNIEEKQVRIGALLHAVQSGVAADHARGGRDGEPKHLRVGINNAMVDSAVVVKLLIDKGIFTMDEYLDGLIVGLEEEVARYEKMLSEKMDKKVKLA